MKLSWMLRLYFEKKKMENDEYQVLLNLHTQK